MESEVTDRRKDCPYWQQIQHARTGGPSNPDKESEGKDLTYLGSKDKYLSWLLPLINSFRRGPDQLYIEPFMGSCAVLSNIEGKRAGSDVMADLVELWKSLRDGSFTEPSHITKAEYDAAMSPDFNGGVPSATRAYMGFFWSFSGMFDKGYSPDFYRNSRSFYVACQRAKKLAGCALIPGPYSIYTPDKFRDCVIYCDPPYAGTTGYRGTPPFDQAAFYDWCQRMAAAGNTILVSEYDLPSPFKLVGETMADTSMATSKRQGPRPERLYTL